MSDDLGAAAVEAADRLVQAMDRENDELRAELAQVKDALQRFQNATDEYLGDMYPSSHDAAYEAHYAEYSAAWDVARAALEGTDQ